MQCLIRLLAILAVLAPMAAHGQGAVLQGGAAAPGRAPMYVQDGATTIVQDSGPASGATTPGYGFSEMMLTARGTGTPPYASQGSGPLGTNWCSYDAPIINTSGYHYLCLSPNAQGGGLVVYGAGGGASPLPLTFNVNGVPYIFPPSGSAGQQQMTPGGRITIAPGNCAPNTDQVAQVIVYYGPCNGSMVPIYNGTQMQLYPFTQSGTDIVGLQLILGGNWAANTAYDTFIGLKANVATLCTGPAWANSGAGTSSRGAGPGTSQIGSYNGLPTNAVAMTCRDSNTTTFNCPINQCTKVGSFLTNGSPGTIDLKFGTAAAGGGTACICVYNDFNQAWGRAKVTDTNGAATYTNVTWQAYLGDAGNAIKIFTGGQTNAVTVSASGIVSLVAASGANGYVGSSLNSSTPSRPDCTFVTTGVAASALVQTMAVTCQYAPQLGLSVYYEVERSDGANANNFFGNLTDSQFISATFFW